MSKIYFEMDLYGRYESETFNNKELTFFNYFLLSFYDNKIINPCLLKVIKIILDSNGTMPIQNISNSMKCCGQRQIERLFKKNIGMSPKKFSEIVQFKYSLSLLKRHKLPICEVAQTAGYFDQAHFIHSFKKITKTSPKNFLEISS